MFKNQVITPELILKEVGRRYDKIMKHTLVLHKVNQALINSDLSEEVKEHLNTKLESKASRFQEDMLDLIADELKKEV